MPLFHDDLSNPPVFLMVDSHVSQLYTANPGSNFGGSKFSISGMVDTIHLPAAARMSAGSKGMFI